MHVSFSNRNFTPQNVDHFNVGDYQAIVTAVKFKLKLIRFLENGFSFKIHAYIYVGVQSLRIIDKVSKVYVILRLRARHLGR
jgi:hypothetical protein